MLVAGCKIEGVRLRTHDSHSDERGTFTEVFSTEWSDAFDAQQWSIVESRRNVFRGLHLHRRHHECFLLLNGRACIGLYDLRDESSTAGGYALYELSDAKKVLILFPPGILHGWYFHTESMHLQGVTETYNSYQADDNLGCRWDDEDLAIPWPFSSPILSFRAERFPSLRELRRTIEFT